MKKDIVRGSIGLAVLLVLYILVAFLIPFVHTAAFWISFVFMFVAFAVAAVSLYIAFIKSPDAKSKFYGFPIARIGVIYWLAQLILGLVCMALAKFVPGWVAALIYAIMLGVTAIGLISADAVVDEIKIQDEKLKKDISLMRGLQSKVNGIVGLCSSDVRTEVSKVAEEFRFSDPVSSEALSEIENELSLYVDELQTAVVDNDSVAVREICRKASATLLERNRLCKLNKR